MQTLLVVNKSSGFISGVLFGGVPEQDHVGDENLLLAHNYVDSCEFYVREGIVVARPTMQPTVSTTEVQANGADEILITNLPIPATINVKGQIVEVDDGELVMTFDTPGEYRLTVEAFPHKPWEVTIHAT